MEESEEEDEEEDDGEVEIVGGEDEEDVEEDEEDFTFSCTVVSDDWCSNHRVSFITSRELILINQRYH